MKIATVIEKMKAYHKGEYAGKKIDEATTRDKILYGDPDQECTGIITSCWASVDVIKEAIKAKANLIIAHEALFWNHGDHTEWLEESKNETFLAKKQLLDEHGIVVWRDHDYIHSGIPMKDGSYTDGIFYGVADKLGWSEYIVKDIHTPLHYEIPETTLKDLAAFLVERLNLNGVKILGDLNQKVKKIRIPFHVLGDANENINENVDCFLTMELVDFTLAEFVRDSSMLGICKTVIGMGHFNLEEPGMEYMIQYIPEAIEEDIPCKYVQSGDMYQYVCR